MCKDFYSSLLPALDQIRAIPDSLGGRPFTVLRRVRTWTGDRVGLGVKSDSDGYVTVANGASPKIRQISYKEVIASAGKYEDQDLVVGPLTPAYTDCDGYTGGYDPSFFMVPVGGSPIEIYFKVSGPGIDPTSGWYRFTEANFVSPISYTIVLRKTAVVI